MTMADSILIDLDLHPDVQLTRFMQEFAERPVVAPNPDTGRADEPQRIQYAVVWKPEPGMLASLPNLEIIFSLGAGVDAILRDPALPDLPLVRFVDPNLTGHMCNWVVLQVLMHTRRQRGYDALQRKREWKEIHPQPASNELTVGIMGLGELGSACATALLALGFNVCGWSRTQKSVKDVVTYHGDGQLNAFLSKTDILVSLLPHTSATHGILNRDLFEKLSKDGPFGAPVVINGGRGGSQVEADIIACLDERVLHGVSLDVFETEPLPANSRLWTFNNAILTPHMAAVSDPATLASHVRTQIDRYERGEELQHLVDRSRGY